MSDSGPHGPLVSFHFSFHFSYILGLREMAWEYQTASIVDIVFVGLTALNLFILFLTTIT